MAWASKSSRRRYYGYGSYGSSYRSYKTRRRYATGVRKRNSKGFGRKPYSAARNSRKHRRSIGMKKALAAVSALQRTIKQGAAKTFVFNSPEDQRLQVVGTGHYVGHSYFAIPVDAMLNGLAVGSAQKQNLAVVPKATYYVTGVSVDFKLECRSAVELMAVCAAVPVSMVSPFGKKSDGLFVDVDGFSFTLGRGVVENAGGACDMNDAKDAAVSSVLGTVFEKRARDGSYFRAKVAREPGLVPLEVTWDGKAKKRGNVISQSLNGRGAGDNPVGVGAEYESVDLNLAFRKQNVRLWADINKDVDFCAEGGGLSGPQYRIVVGIRPQVFGGEGIATVSAVVRNLEVTVYYRVGGLLS
ncbi:hypothetical protein BBAD15_g12541 [Beauveria bassiana D1-5]|uniref:Uncharacterized protein n=1 Tax=Beauveria bassiana D1-5 TaxID=1245745 RepID=A0A0A2V834_BEABA|nr:hypothetical protein BBAD15_g12541 [Beauveria bassiana D1-5]